MSAEWPLREVTRIKEEEGESEIRLIGSCEGRKCERTFGVNVEGCLVWVAGVAVERATRSTTRIAPDEELRTSASEGLFRTGLAPSGVVRGRGADLEKGLSVGGGGAK